MHPHYLTSYIFWKKWFRDHPQNPNFGGYIFPQPIEQFREKVWKGRSVCPICNDFKSVQVGEDGVLIEPTEVYCICTVLEFIMDRWKGNKLFESTWKRDANIDELKPFGDKQAINDLKEFKVYIKQWVNNPTRWVWVQSSNTGTGKTKTMHWIRATLGSMVTYVSVEQMAAQMFNLLNTNKDKLEEMKKHLRDAPILILDDMG
ncbi:MAG TPA: hypothetical protein PLU50_09325, partial [Pseudobdellovibrionaceae bacterium]|nr:hypothetical protein [Pseudobdellovibrionaceae bacterium]